MSGIASYLGQKREYGVLRPLQNLHKVPVLEQEKAGDLRDKIVPSALLKQSLQISIGPANGCRTDVH